MGPEETTLEVSISARVRSKYQRRVELIIDLDMGTGKYMQSMILRVCCRNKKGAANQPAGSDG